MISIYILAGPTASGKSKTALKLAEKFNCEIINADSKQVYREIDIGTSKPSLEEYKKIPHHLFNICDLSQQYTALDYQRDAEKVIYEIHQRGKIPLVVGGTGLYLKALLHGFFEGPKAQPQLRVEIEEKIKNEGLLSVYHWLCKVDPDSAQKIKATDPVRIIRALEVYLVSGKLMSVLQKEHAFLKNNYQALQMGIEIDRDELYRRIDQRVLDMVKQGLEAEAKILFEKWPHSPILPKAIGYKEWMPYWKNEITEDEVIGLIQKNTRNYAKRQLTWFRNQEKINWVKNFDEVTLLIEKFRSG
ncbi:MAG: tRNA (adenosine(37)-N6)-dimethylallyltransferase MiaA [Deltaproteobacteria bacterium RIFCSPLOWO2_12_FULL_40_28]|nr:MAG: tRNA (adenosine(37)-N6)-dimethylallyltransferase MiaA [Deltaproteobacteria bacterium RIFCSPHIGHO2_02_FULL_40_28]OGQ20856.1 MAG: tRNA (adenosine(37)-N6)-dimethylallyltransferase MiaA [Deltaproteobacteria bacterium RIFCSPHIGHO2_12_FULL_40_32]OGQ39257.1 MAG: tRNA (adenosine(37)-N6)-dimethylallyltransferase MiaA [Deltaproteobacteria bacterium RIFCSPLOWO2_02_FULL_40_36]OGQ54538.1 MAG: tRNA (adenosine(37)-N6)-dimethylallyltransferase MiaA [Deltaproteobacteria bacterium RIFCSPLOWO2_12_FULL_40_2